MLLYLMAAPTRKSISKWKTGSNTNRASKPSVGLDPESAAGRDEARVGADLHGVGGDREVADDPHRDDAVAELDADAILRRDPRRQVGESRVEAADGENERGVGAEARPHDQRAGDRQQRDVRVAQHRVDRQQLAR